jgi:hypothetical protein
LVSVPAAGIIIAPNIPYVQHDIKLCDIWRRCNIQIALAIFPTIARARFFEFDPLIQNQICQGTMFQKLLMN